MEDLYIHKARADDYETYVSYMNDPKPKFDEYVNTRRKELIYDRLSTGPLADYKDYIRTNLTTLKDRLEILRPKITDFTTSNLFVIKEKRKADGKYVPLEYSEREKLVSKMSSILLTTFIKILKIDGNLDLQSFEARLRSDEEGVRRLDEEEIKNN